jgi:hypothetical protein
MREEKVEGSQSRPADTVFVEIKNSRPVSDDAVAAVADDLKEMAGVERAFVMTPASMCPATSEAPPPSVVIEIDYRSASELADGFATDASRNDLIAKLRSALVFSEEDIVYQPMLRNNNGLSIPRYWRHGVALCTYLIEYPGEAENLEAWLEYFDNAHAPILTRLPGVRQVTSFRPAVLPAARVPWLLDRMMQRNKIVFDDKTALEDALQSPVIGEVRADGKKFPRYSSAPRRTAMYTRLAQSTTRPS